MNLVTIPPAEQAKMKSIPVERIAERLVGGVQRQRSNWKQEKTETGVINGMKFTQDSLGGNPDSRINGTCEDLCM